MSKQYHITYIDRRTGQIEVGRVFVPRGSSAVAERRAAIQAAGFKFPAARRSSIRAVGIQTPTVDKAAS